MFTEVVPFETAKVLKEINFGVAVQNRYALEDGFISDMNFPHRIHKGELFYIPDDCYFTSECIFAPTYADVIDWFWDNGLFIHIDYFGTPERKGWIGNVTSVESGYIQWSERGEDFHDLIFKLFNKALAIIKKEV